jgi:YfiH family protein
VTGAAPPPTQVHANGVQTWPVDLGDGVLAAVTTRHGGHSTGAYAGCNLAFHVGDDPAAVRANRALVCAALGVDRLTVADQQHGRTVAVVDEALAGAGHDSLEDAVARLPATDGLVTDVPGVALAVLVADCAPVVLHDPVRGALGVAHAGRRGVVLDVLGATIDALRERYGTAPGDLRAAVGPCIGPASYELGGAELEETSAALGDDLLVPTRPGHARFDLPTAVHRRLAESGVPADQVQGVAVDTFTATDDLFSHRVERPCGRFALVAALR